MKDTETQWFSLVKPYVKYRKVSIDEEIAEAEAVVKKLKRQRREGYLVKTRHSRIRAAAGIPLRTASGEDNKVVGYDIPEGEQGTITRMRVSMIMAHLEQYGYEPELACLREHVTKGVCKI